MTERFAIPLHRAFVYQGRRITYRRRARDPERSYLFYDAAGIQITFTHEELRRVRNDGELRDWTDDLGSTAAVTSGRTPICWQTATNSEKDEALRQAEYCMAWAAQPGTLRTSPGLQPLIDEVYRRRRSDSEAARRFEPPPPCVSSVQKWIRKWLHGDRRADALLPQSRNRGNRRDKLTYDVRELVSQVIDEFYLTRRRLPVAAVHRELTKLVKARNERLPPGRRIPLPCYDSLRVAVSKLCQFTVDYCRRGASYAKEKWRAIGSGIVTDHANEVWEIDDTRVDLICLGEDGKIVIGRPWLTLVIDRHTRMIMGFVISFSPPDTRTALQALKMAILSKEEILRRHPDIRGPYEACGLPDVVHVDNGKHYNSNAFKRALTRLGIQHAAMPVLKAWYKGIVERAIGTVSRQVFHVVSGSTYSGIYERDRETAPEDVATSTVPELREKLLKWIVEDYQHRRHKGIDDAPYAMWRQSLARTEQRLLPERNAIEEALSTTEARTLRRGGGLQFRNLIYLADELVRLRMLPKAEKVDELVIRIDEDDLTVIHFFDPKSSEWVPAFIRKDLYSRVEGRTLEEYELARALRRNRPEEFGDNDPDYVETYAEVDRMRDEGAGSKKLGDRAKAEAARERLIDAGKRLTKRYEPPTVSGADDLSSAVDRVAQLGLGSPTKRTSPEATPVAASAGAQGAPAQTEGRKAPVVRVRKKQEGGS